GAKRFDIANIYLVYLALVAATIGVVRYGIGVGVAIAINQMYGAEATAQALLSFGTSDMSKVFRLFDIRLLDGLLIVGLSLAAALVGSLIPLLRNIRRNPIRDMRDD